ncbi:MAG: radical SAM family heme chaperone HemW [Gemmatimonadetes bacterium]|nr:radical SAM family heme chaperone HemW [Gemmatimonadota bacterium]
MPADAFPPVSVGGGGDGIGTVSGGAAATVASVYVHAPFCVRRCFYCDFAVQVRRTGGVDEWLEALAGEVAFVRGEGLFGLADELSTLYVGGGTPSLLGPEAMAGLGRVLGPERLRGGGLEWTAEANPESLTPEVALRWREAGVNRLSLGAQSFHEPALRWMGRMHGADGAARAVRRAREAGYENIGIDLIFGLPAHLGRPWREDLERALELDVSHISLYGLSVEPATPLGRAVAKGVEAPVDEEGYREEFLLAAEVLEAAGYAHYEVSNFARPGAESRHNSVYWTGAPYLGLGNGAHSYTGHRRNGGGPVRRWNRRDWSAYRNAACSGASPEEGRESLSVDAVRLERVWLGLRTTRGLDTAGWKERARELARDWRRRGLADVTDGVVRLTREGWLVMDRLAVELEATLSP